MKIEELEALATALGWPLAVIVFVLLILAKNGWLKLIVRGDREEVFGALRSDVNALETGVKGLVDRMHLFEVDLAVLKDRWDREKGD